MAIVLKDRVKETAAAPGTGTITLAGAASGFQAFSAIGNGNTTYFAIVDSASGAWEVNYGTYTSSGTTLSRNATPLSSSNAGALVNFTGTVDVFCTYPSEKAIYEEVTGNVLIDGGPITVIGTGVTTYTTFSAALGELYANINSFAQLYAQNLNDGAAASADFVAYNDIGDGTNNFVDVGINSSNYSDATYPIFTPGSAYAFNDGGEMFVGSATDDLVLFAGGTDVTDEAVRVDKTTKAVTTVADVNVGGALDVTGAATFGSTVLLNADPTLNLQAATKQYVDTAVSTGLHLHQPVNVATTGNLTATYNNGASGVGATLTNSGTQVALSIDGVSVSVNNRVLVWQQSTPAQNGVYVVTTVGSGSTNWVLTRSSDADNYNPQSDTGLGGGDYFYVQSGTTGAGDSYVCTNTGTITFGTTAITFAQFSGAITYVGGTNIDVSGQTISLTGTVAATNGGTGTATVTTGDLLYGSGTNTWGKLGIGAAYKPLVVNGAGTNVEWNALALNQSGTVSGSLPATNGGTGLNAYTLGDTIYSSASNTLLALSGNTTTTKKFLTQTGTGSASAAPAWGTISGSDVSGNISGSAGSVANALTLGTYLTGTSFNGSSAVTVTVDATSANTVSKVVARDSSGNFSAGTITATLSGAATSATTATNIAGGAANQLHYQSASGTTAFATAPTVTSTYLYWNGSAFAWGAVASGTVTSITAGTYLTGGTITTSGTIAVDATSANTASKVVARDASGNFSAGTITATLSGNATTATSVSNALTLGSYLTGTSYNGGTAVTAAVDATSANTASKVVARDASGNFSAGTITATLSGTATNVSGTVAVANGGTGLTSLTAGYIPFGAGTSAFGNSSNFFWDNANIRLGIGTSSPSEKLHISGANPYILLQGTEASGQTLYIREITGGFYFGQYAVGTRMFLSPAGGLGVGTTADAGSGGIYATGNITAYYSSDIKFKENVRTIPNAAATVKAIGGKLFDWTDAYIADHGGEDGYFVQKNDFGIIAQDAQKHFPICVRTRPDGSLAVDYEKLSALAMAAIAEQEDRIAKLEALVAQLIKG